MTAFVLVPGAWLGAWAWDDVVPGLVAAGHGVHAVTLPGLAERADEAPASSIDLSAHVADVSALIVDHDLDEVRLVVHSYAGALGAMVADRVPQRIGRLVRLTRAGDAIPRRLLWCEGDGPVPEQVGVPASEVSVLPAGHWPQLTHPELVVSALLDS